MVRCPGASKSTPGRSLGARPAVADVSVAARERSQQFAGFLEEGVVVAIARAEEPPDVPPRAFRRQRVEHRHHRGCAHAGAQQDDRSLARAEREGAPGRAHIQRIAHPGAIAEVGAGHAVELPLHTHPIAPCARRPGERVAAQDGRRRRLEPDAKHHELAWQGGREWQTVRGLEVQGDHTPALAGDPRDPQRAEARPRRRRARLWGEPGVACLLAAAPLPFEHGLEGTLPAGAERRDAQRPLQFRPGVARQVEECVHLRHRHALRANGHPDDLVPGPDFALLEDAQVEAGPSVRHKQRRHARLIHADADPEACHARLRHLEERFADAIPVADAHLVVGQALDGEVLAELPKGEAAPAKLVLPVAVGSDLVDEHGPLLAAVAGQVALSVAVDVEAPHHPPPRDGRLPDGRVDGPAVPGDVAWEADIHGEQARHRGLLPPPHTRSIVPTFPPPGNSVVLAGSAAVSCRVAFLPTVRHVLPCTTVLPASRVAPSPFRQACVPRRVPNHNSRRLKSLFRESGYGATVPASASAWRAMQGRPSIFRSPYWLQMPSARRRGKTTHDRSPPVRFRSRRRSCSPSRRANRGERASSTAAHRGAPEDRGPRPVDALATIHHCSRRARCAGLA